MNIEDNKNKYIDLLLSTGVDNINELVEYIKNSDFFTAPASSVYHYNVVGGLCAHSLNVYENMVKLKELYCPELSDKEVKIVSLLHDLAKIDFYERYVQNKKVYKPTGKQCDFVGKYDWYQVETFKVKDSQHRDIMFGEHGLNSYMIASKFIKLTDAEAAAIINHHMSLDNGRPRTDISEILNRYPLATMLCLADQVSAYITENPYMINE